MCSSVFLKSLSLQGPAQPRLDCLLMGPSIQGSLWQGFAFRLLKRWTVPPNPHHSQQSLGPSLLSEEELPHCTFFGGQSLLRSSSNSIVSPCLWNSKMLQTQTLERDPSLTAKPHRFTHHLSQGGPWPRAPEKGRLGPQLGPLLAALPAWGSGPASSSPK